MSQRICLGSAVVTLVCLAGCGSGSGGATKPTDIILPDDSRDVAELCRKLGGHVVMEVTSIDFQPTADVSNAAANAVEPSAKVDDALLARIATLPKLRSLSLVSSNVTDAGLAHLKGMERLETLDLSGSPNITDAGLEHLKELRPLRMLVIRGCGQITVAGREELRTFFNEKYGVKQLLVTGP